MAINWYPKHMSAAKESLRRDLKLVDVVFELLDSRIPSSSKNPDIDVIIGQKLRIVVLSKSDLSSDDGDRQWVDHFAGSGTRAISLDSRNSNAVRKLVNAANAAARGKAKEQSRKAVGNRPLRIMIVGIPNVGKSMLANALVGRKGAKVANRPGSSKGPQWLKRKGNLELLDTPGILWPDLEDEEVALNLALTGAVRDEAMDIEALALKLVEKLLHIAPQNLAKRYTVQAESDPLGLLESIASKRGCITRNGETDYMRVSSLILNEFRKGAVGKITLEYPNPA